MCVCVECRVCVWSVFVCGGVCVGVWGVEQHSTVYMYNLPIIACRSMNYACAHELLQPSVSQDNNDTLAWG